MSLQIANLSIGISTSRDFVTSLAFMLFCYVMLICYAVILGCCVILLCYFVVLFLLCYYIILLDYADKFCCCVMWCCMLLCVLLGMAGESGYPGKGAYRVSQRSVHREQEAARSAQDHKGSIRLWQASPVPWDGSQSAEILLHLGWPRPNVWWSKEIYLTCECQVANLYNRI